MQRQRSLKVYKAVLYAKVVCLQQTLEDLSAIGQKIESGKFLLPEYYDFVDVELACALDNVEAGIILIPGSTVKAVLAMLPKEASEMVKDNVNSFCVAIVSKWKATCSWNLAELERNQLTQVELWRLAKILDPSQKHMMSKSFEEYRELFLLAVPALDSFREDFAHYIKEDTPANQDIDLLTYWSKSKYPNLRGVALNILCMPTGSCDAERSFSKLRVLQNPRRSSMSDKLLKSVLCFLSTRTSDQ